MHKYKHKHTYQYQPAANQLSSWKTGWKQLNLEQILILVCAIISVGEDVIFFHVHKISLCFHNNDKSEMNNFIAGFGFFSPQGSWLSLSSDCKQTESEINNISF